MEAQRPIIALLTDFGVDDTYVGAMKSVILGRAPDCAFIDLSHAVAPQNIRQAAYLLWTAYRFLPNGTTTLCVVDPGVGTERRPIAVRWPGGFFVGPDNGWLTYVVRDSTGEDKGPGERPLPQGWQAVELSERQFWLEPVSATFHGRDIFGPVAAALAAGTAVEELGDVRKCINVFSPHRVEGEAGTVRGHVIHVDHFGNLITDIGAAHLSERFMVTLGGGTIDGPSRSYQSSDPLVALVGSSGLLEIAAPNASAARLIMVGVGEPVTVVTRHQSEVGATA